MHRSEIDKIIARLGEAGVTLVPLSLYFQNGWAKVEIALARGVVVVSLTLVAVVFSRSLRSGPP